MHMERHTHALFIATSSQSCMIMVPSMRVIHVKIIPLDNITSLEVSRALYYSIPVIGFHKEHMQLGMLPEEASACYQRLDLAIRFHILMYSERVQISPALALILLLLALMLKNVGSDCSCKH